MREAPSTIAHNECQSNADCGVAGLCIAQQCRGTSRNATFQNLLFQVTPPADGSSVAGVQFLVPDVDVSGGDALLLLQQISQVSGEVKAKSLNCPPLFGEPGAVLATANDLSIPAQVSLIPTAGALGLFTPRAVVSAELRDDKYFGFSVNVPPGQYDVYVQPKHQPDESCPVPPLLLRGQGIAKGIFPFEIGLPEPSVFEFHVTWPPGNGELNGWMVDMLDPASGRAISNRVQLTPEKGGKSYVATLSYNPVLVAKPDAQPQEAQPADQLLRLSPPDGLPESAAAPTLLLSRSGLALFGAATGTLSNFTSLPQAVHVIGQVTAANTPQSVAANITLVATEIAGIDQGVLASFSRTVSVSADSHTFDVYLLPGKYRVSTVPQAPLDPTQGNEAPLAADVRPWTVPSTPAEQQGKVIELGVALPITGRVVDASGNGVAAAQVQAAASPLSLTEPNFLRQALDGTAFVPRASPSGVSGDGNFSL
ncbi:MAG TPA: hypothetical protein VGJ91_06240, partial [Polyangiaceae bacterium]